MKNTRFSLEATFKIDDETSTLRLVDCEWDGDQNTIDSRISRWLLEELAKASDPNSLKAEERVRRRRRTELGERQLLAELQEKYEGTRP